MEELIKLVQSCYTIKTRRDGLWGCARTRVGVWMDGMRVAVAGAAPEAAENLAHRSSSQSSLPPLNHLLPTDDTPRPLRHKRKHKPPHKHDTHIHSYLE